MMSLYAACFRIIHISWTSVCGQLEKFHGNLKAKCINTPTNRCYVDVLCMNLRICPQLMLHVLSLRWSALANAVYGYCRERSPLKGLKGTDRRL